LSFNHASNAGGSTQQQQKDLRKVSLVPPTDDQFDMFMWGLSPTTVHEVAGSALGFFEYQKRQEAAFFTHQHTQLTERFQKANHSANLSKELQDTV
jgi:hypothetical protein